MTLTIIFIIPILGVLFSTLGTSFLFNFSLKNKMFSISNKIIGIALNMSILPLFVSLFLFTLYDSSTNQFQFVKESVEIGYFNFNLGLDGLSLFFILITTIITPVALLSNWVSVTKDVFLFVVVILSLEILLLIVFIILDFLMFYVFFESILPPLFILIGFFGAENRVRASFYLFLYTLSGSLFLLLSVLGISSIVNNTDYDVVFKVNFVYLTQLFLFSGMFIAFAVKTPTAFLNTWLLKAHVESPLGGSIILAAIVLKLSLYGISRLILPILPKAYLMYTSIIFSIGVITILYASVSTLRTIDVKELIAYSSVSHAAVYLLGMFSNSIQGIEGAIILGLAHGLVSPGLFICAGGVLYDRSHTRIVAFYRGMAQTMPLFAILFFILCLANCGAPLSLNFIGEFLSLYGVFEKSPLYGLFASSSIVFSAGYTIYMYQKISFGGNFSKTFTNNVPDLNKREFMILFMLVALTIIFGIYPAPILDSIHYSVSTLIYCFDYNVISCEGTGGWQNFYIENSSFNLGRASLALFITLAIVKTLDYIIYYFSIFILKSNKDSYVTLKDRVIQLLIRLLVYLSKNWYSFIPYTNIIISVICQIIYIFIIPCTDLIYTVSDGILNTNLTDIAYRIDSTDWDYMNNLIEVYSINCWIDEYSISGIYDSPNTYPIGEYLTTSPTTEHPYTSVIDTKESTYLCSNPSGGGNTGGTSSSGGNTSGTSNGTGSFNPRSCLDSNGGAHTWESDTTPISNETRCAMDSSHPACRGSSPKYHFCVSCGKYICNSCS